MSITNLQWFCINCNMIWWIAIRLPNMPVLPLDCHLPTQNTTHTISYSNEQTTKETKAINNSYIYIYISHVNVTQTVPDISPLMPMHQDPLLVLHWRHLSVIPSQRASNTENVSIPWCLHGRKRYILESIITVQYLDCRISHAYAWWLLLHQYRRHVVLVPGEPLPQLQP